MLLSATRAFLENFMNNKTNYWLLENRVFENDFLKIVEHSKIVILVALFNSIQTPRRAIQLKIKKKRFLRGAISLYFLKKILNDWITSP